MEAAARQSSAMDSPLTPLERALVRSVEAGQSFEPTGEQLRAGAAIRGELIRAMLLGLPLKGHPASRALRPKAALITAHGLRIVRAGADCRAAGAPEELPRLLVSGQLDLCGMRGVGGIPLPPLEFSHCIFERPIRLAGSHVQSLTLRSSRFPTLDAASATIDGEVTLSDCRPRNEPRFEPARWFLARELAAEKAQEKGGELALGSKEGHFFIGDLPAPSENEDCGCPLCGPRKGPDDGSCRHCCVVNFSSAKVGGEVVIANSFLCAPGLIGRPYVTPAPRAPRDPYAVRLDSMRVRGSISLNECVCVGALNFISARIEEDVWIWGGRYVASAERPTFDFQLATIGGILTFRARYPSEKEEADERAKGRVIRSLPVVVIGQISAIGLEAGEVWIGEGFFYGQDRNKRGSFPTINFAKANIRKSFKVGSYHEYQVLDPDRRTGAAKIHGEICLAAANLGKNLELHGVDADGMAQVLGLAGKFYRSFADHFDEPPYLKIKAHGVHIDRRVHISHGRFRDASLALDQRPGDAVGGAEDPGQSCEVTSIPAAIDFWKSTIGAGFRIEEHSSAEGAIRLNNCVISREVIIGCSRIDPGPAELPPEGVNPPAIPRLLDVSESTIDGHVKIGRRDTDEPERAPQNADTRRQVISIAGAVSFESVNVQGSLLLGHVTLDLSRYALEEGNPKLRGHEGRVALSLRDCICSADFEVHSLRWNLPQVRERASSASGLLDWAKAWAGGASFAAIDEDSYAVIDLRGLQCASLIDGFGNEWGLIYRLQLRLAGMKIGEVEPATHEAPHAPSRRPERPRLRWLAHHNIVQEIGPPQTVATNAPKLITFRERFHCSRRDKFVPQAYDVFSLAYRKAGEYLTADRILVEKKDALNALYLWRLWRRWYSPTWYFYPRLLFAAAFLQLFFMNRSERWLFVETWHTGLTYSVFGIATLVFLGWPIVAAGFQTLFRHLFLYGLSTERALGVFAAAILIGWVGVHAARNGQVDIAPVWTMGEGALSDHVALVREVPPEPGNPGAEGVLRDQARAVTATPSLCDRDVSSLLYALDLFIPLVDLDQERRCTIREALPGSTWDDYFGWRVAKAVYELLGWIITSLMILTITGVLRRDLER